LPQLVTPPAHYTRSQHSTIKYITIIHLHSGHMNAAQCCLVFMLQLCFLNFF